MRQSLPIADGRDFACRTDETASAAANIHRHFWSTKWIRNRAHGSLTPSSNRSFGMLAFRMRTWWKLAPLLLAVTPGIVVNVLPGKARAALADTLENALHRPLVGAFWVFCLDEVQTIISLAVNDRRWAGS